MKKQTVRFGEFVMQRVEERAAQEGVSAAQYIRDATYSRLIYEAVVNSSDRDKALREEVRALVRDIREGAPIPGTTKPPPKRG